MTNRLELHTKLTTLIGNNNAYFQPPESFKMKYPCVLYNNEAGETTKACNKLYKYTPKYTVTFMYTEDKPNIVTDMLLSFDYCNLDRVFVNDNLYHYIFTLYY